MYNVIEPLGSILMRSCVFLYLFYNSTPEYEDDSWGFIQFAKRILLIKQDCCSLRVACGVEVGVGQGGLWLIDRLRYKSHRLV